MLINEVFQYFDPILRIVAGGSYLKEEITSISSCSADAATFIIRFLLDNKLITQSGDLYSFPGNSVRALKTKERQLLALLTVDNMPEVGTNVFCEVVSGPVITGNIYRKMSVHPFWVNLYLKFFFTNGLVFKTYTEIRGIETDCYVLFPAGSSNRGRVTNVGLN